MICTDRLVGKNPPPTSFFFFFFPFLPADGATTSLLFSPFYTRETGSRLFNLPKVMDKQVGFRDAHKLTVDQKAGQTAPSEPFSYLNKGFYRSGIYHMKHCVVFIIKVSTVRSLFQAHKLISRSTDCTKAICSLSCPVPPW